MEPYLSSPAATGQRTMAIGLPIRNLEYKTRRVITEENRKLEKTEGGDEGSQKARKNRKKKRR
jgi:hypothetical protein